MADTNRNQWEDRTGWNQNRNSRDQYDRSRDDYSSNYGNSQSDSRYGGEDYRSDAPYKSDRYDKINERRDDYSNLDRNRDRSTNMGSGYDAYNYGQTVGSFNQSKDGSYSQRFDYDDYRNRSNYQNRDSGYDSDYNRRYGRSGSDNYGTGSYYGNNYRDRYERSGDMHSRDGHHENRNRSNGGERDWWDRTSDEVASWFGDDDAQRRRDRDKAMGPHRGKGPKGYSRSDERIKDDINDRLSDDSFIDASEIDVTVENCEVVLTGTVDSREEKRRAEDIAERISGVKNVENRLKVKNREGKNDGATIYRDNRY
jgi:osmotically-inducible protein OsmY